MKTSTMAVLAAFAALSSIAAADSKTASDRSFTHSGGGTASRPTTYGPNGAAIGVGISGSGSVSGSVSVLWTVEYVSSNPYGTPPSIYVDYSGKFTDYCSASIMAYGGNATAVGPSGSSAYISLPGNNGMVSSGSSGPYYYYTGTVYDTASWTWTGSDWRATVDVITDTPSASASLPGPPTYYWAGAGSSCYWALVP